MPILTPAELQQLVIQGGVGAVTLDTSVFDQFGCNLGFRTLTALEQFKGSGVGVLFSEVTLGEVKAHIARDAEEAAEKARVGLKSFQKIWRLEFDRAAVEAQIGLRVDAAQRAQQLIDEYLARVGGGVVPSEPGATVNELLRRYFAPEPPFSKKDGKKSEFPDAIALLALEHWAEERGTKLLAVSRDNDWSRYAETSPGIIVVKDLTEALSFFNAAGGILAETLLKRLRAGDAPTLMRALERAIENFVEDFDIEASSSFFYEEEATGSSVFAIRIPEIAEMRPLRSDESTWTLAIDVEADVEFSANFRLSVRDGIDRDYVSLGGHEATTSGTYDFPLTVTVYKDDLADPEPFDVEVERRSLTADFGEIEPAWGYEE